MAIMQIPGHDRDAVSIVERVDAELAALFDGTAAPERWTVQCAGCRRDYEHTEGVHDGYCDECEQAYIDDAVAELAAMSPIYSEDLVGLEDARVELDKLAVDEWAAVERAAA